MERPDEDATAAEIAEWMEADFAESLAEGMASAVEEETEDEDGKEPEDG
jgi:hypothetical protein